MVEVNPAGWFQALATHTAEQLRTYVGNTFAVPQGANSLKTLGAVHPALGTAMAVTQNGTPNMTVNVGAGSCWVSGTETTKQGTYFCQNDAVKSLTITASDPTLNRIDLIVAKVQDAQYSGSINAWSLVVVQGVASGSPAIPTAPANSITLAQITISAGVTSITTGAIADRRPWNAALGGVVPCTSTVPPTNPYNGLYGHELDTGRTIRYNGTNWHQVGIHYCTAATRPAGPFNGMKIYETDTGLTWNWNGTAWVPASPGFVGSTKRASDVTFTTTETLADSLTFTVYPGRRYQILWEGLYSSSSASVDNGNIIFRWKAGATVDLTGTNFKNKLVQPPVTNVNVALTMTDFLTGLPSGQVTVGLFGIRTSGSGTHTLSGGFGPAQISVFDVTVS